MRKIGLAITIGLLVSAMGLQASVQTAAASSSPQLKVVIVVGAVEGTTSSYRADANAYAAEFSKFTSNVIKVYSPNATWSAVQAAAHGANVLVYLGHGNGYPNPYLSYLQPTKDDGMGLNASAGNGDSNKQYYGENYMAQLQLAPNAVVMLNHLCYASGNSESGKTLATLAVAKTRIDGFGSGFLRGNARAVIAEGLGSLNPYIDAIFTPHLTLDQIWKTYPGNHNNFSSWASSRNAGFTSQMDPQTGGEVYYRSMVSLPGLTTDDVRTVVTYDPTTYHPMTPPFRLLDTRAGKGLTGKFAANTPRTFTVAGVGQIEAGATAITGNLTVVNESSSGAIYLGPGAISSPTTSTINFPKGVVTANGVTIALSTKGMLSATYLAGAGATTDLVLDVTGYFTPDATGSTYHPLTPARILDTRKKVGLPGKLVANTPATFLVWGQGKVPDKATAVTGNLTVVGSNNSYAVYMGPLAVVKPDTSTINFSKGQILANNLTVTLSPNGHLSATFLSSTGYTTDLVFDVTGYYTADLSGDRFVPITPARMVDSRYGNGLSGALPANTPRQFQLIGRGIPAGALAVSANATVTNETNSYAIFVGPDAIAHPSTSTLNFERGDVRANGLTVPLASGGCLWATYLSSAGNTTQLIVDVTGYFTP
jgi:hypothetical protein